jgi:hypothetical protein
MLTLKPNYPLYADDLDEVEFPQAFSLLMPDELPPKIIPDCR